MKRTKEELIEMIDNLNDHKLVNPIKDILKIMVEEFYINNIEDNTNKKQEVIETTSTKNTKVVEIEKIPMTSSIKPKKDVFSLDDYPSMNI